jgi:hypothetical protein
MYEVELMSKNNRNKVERWLTMWLFISKKIKWTFNYLIYNFLLNMYIKVMIYDNISRY